MLCALALIVVERGAADILHPETCIVGGIGIEGGELPVLLVRGHHLAFLVAFQRQFSEILLVVDVRLHIHVGEGHGLTCGDVDHSDALHAAGQLLGQHIEVGDVHQFALGFHVGIVGEALHEPYAPGEALHPERIFRNLPFTLVGEAQGLLLKGACNGVLAYLREILGEA